MLGVTLRWTRTQPRESTNTPSRFMLWSSGMMGHLARIQTLSCLLPLQVVYEDLTMVHLTSPYVPEYLAFREVGFLVDAISRLGKNKPELLPQVI